MHYIITHIIVPVIFHKETEIAPLKQHRMASWQHNMPVSTQLLPTPPNLLFA